MKPKLLVILGPTATGKSGLAVELAKQFSGEVISADSRQIYKGLDIGSGKITHEEIRDVPHHLLDVVDPIDTFSVTDFKAQAEKIISDIHTRGHVPIIAGGTGLYIQAVVDNVITPEVPPNPKLREKLSTKTPDELYKILLEKDPSRAATIERHNPRRLIRALEIVEALGSVPDIDTSFPTNHSESPYDVLQIGLKVDQNTLKKNIQKRTDARLKAGWTDEIKRLHQSGVSWDRMKEFGLGYACIADYLQGNINKDSIFDCITNREIRYAKRQVRWFRRDTRITWLSPQEKDKARETVKVFLAS